MNSIARDFRISALQIQGPKQSLPRFPAADARSRA